MEQIGQKLIGITTYVNDFKVAALIDKLKIFSKSADAVMDLQICMNVMISLSLTGNSSMTPADRRRQEAVTRLLNSFPTDFSVSITGSMPCVSMSTVRFFRHSPSGPPKKHFEDGEIFYLSNAEMESSRIMSLGFFDRHSDINSTIAKVFRSPAVICA